MDRLYEFSFELKGRKKQYDIDIEVYSPDVYFGWRFKIHIYYDFERVYYFKHTSNEFVEINEKLIDDISESKLPNFEKEYLKEVTDFSILLMEAIL
ncbi:MAG: hypothetical protein ACRCX2_38195 [Paraclostridium sp.]